MKTIEERNAKKFGTAYYFDYKQKSYMIVRSDNVSHQTDKRIIVEQGIESFEEAKKKAIEFTKKYQQLVTIVTELGSTNVEG